MNKLKRFFHPPVLATMLLLLLLTINTFGTVTVFRHGLEQEAIHNIWDNIDNLINSIALTTENDHVELEAIGRMIGAQKTITPETTKTILSSFQNVGSISDLYLLLPDNRLLSQHGEYVPNNLNLDFAEESHKDNYISRRLDGFADLNEKLLYQAVPVKKDGTVIAVLYGIIRLERLSERFAVNCFNGSAFVYLTEGDTGNFILDTWHDTLTNIEEFETTDAKPGYNFDEGIAALRRGETGMLVLNSKTMKEPIYLCYKGMGINDWSLALYVGESTVFENYNKINRTQMFLSIVKFISIAIYLVWLFIYNNKKAVEKEEQLHQINYMFEIQQSLFDAHQNVIHMQDALKTIANELQAETVFFVTIKDRQLKHAYSWSAIHTQVSTELHDLPYIRRELYRTGNYLIYDMKKFKEIAPEDYLFLQEMKIQNLMLTLVQDSNKNAVGVLGAWNMKHQWEDTRYLAYVGINFFLAYQNIANQEKIDEMASIDMLTGLLNRNRYETALKQYEHGAPNPSACVYIDVNGLHELNNCLGHAAGDEMLRFIAEALQRNFGKEHTYRIGGDEFLAFAFDVSPEETAKKADLLRARVESRDYHISIGIEYQNTNSGMEKIVALAEKKMYEEKQDYYKQKKNVQKARQMNIKLEEILQEKRDADMFLSLIAPHFTGVYIVDFERDTTRSIYIPQDMKSLLSQYNGSFSLTLEAYISSVVAPEDQELLRSALQYESLTSKLSENDVVHVQYNRKDLVSIRLRIYKAARFDDVSKESIWIFEKDMG